MKIAIWTTALAGNIQCLLKDKVEKMAVFSPAHHGLKNNEKTRVSPHIGFSTRFKYLWDLCETVIQGPSVVTGHIIMKVLFNQCRWPVIFRCPTDTPEKNQISKRPYIMSSNSELILQVVWSYDTRCFHMNYVVYTVNWSMNLLSSQVNGRSFCGMSA